MSNTIVADTTVSRLLKLTELLAVSILTTVFASCMSVGSAGTQSEPDTGVASLETASEALWSLTAPEAIGEPGGNRFNSGTTVVPFPPGWGGTRLSERPRIVEAVLFPEDDRSLTIVLGSLRHPTATGHEGVIAYLLAEIVAVPFVLPGNFVQTLSDDSWYLGAPTNREEESVRLRLQRAADRYHFAAVYGPTDTISSDDVTAVLAGMRPARPEETVYAIRKDELAGLEQGENGWSLVEYSARGLVFLRSTDAGTLVVSARQIDPSEADILTATEDRRFAWLGPDPVVLVPVSGEIGTNRSERYLASGDHFLVEISIAVLPEDRQSSPPTERSPSPESLISLPAVQSLLAQNVWIEEER